MAPITVSPWYLVALSAVAWYCIFGLQQKSGLWDLFKADTEANLSRLPGSTVDGTFRTSYTGFPGVDVRVAGIVRFFYIMASGGPVSVFSFWFAGQFVALHGLMFLEGLRAGNRGKLISHTALWGTMYQTLTCGFTVPLWVATWLWTSPIARLSAATPSATLTAALSIDDADLSVLPHSIIWGYILPTVLACLPTPGLISPDQKISYLLIWQFFPILTSVAHFFLSAAARRLRPRGVHAKPAPSPELAKAELAHRLRWIYIFLLIFTASSHTITMLYVLFPSLRTESLAPLDPSSIDFLSVFQPASTPFKVVPVKTIAEGALNLLQYDLYAGAAAMLYWASQQYQAATDAPNLSTLLTLLSGPAGAALLLVWRRDERLLLGSVPKAKAT